MFANSFFFVIVDTTPVFSFYKVDVLEMSNVNNYEVSPVNDDTNSDAFIKSFETPKKIRKKDRDYVSCKFYIPQKKRNCNARPHKGI